MPHGVVQILPVEAFSDPSYGLNHEARSDRYSDDSPRPPTVAGWPSIQAAIRRGELYVIETSTPGLTAMLRFQPNAPGSGDYEIHRRPRGRVEKGRTEKVTPVPADEPDGRLSML